MCVTRLHYEIWFWLEFPKEWGVHVVMCLQGFCVFAKLHVLYTITVNLLYILMYFVLHIPYIMTHYYTLWHTMTTHYGTLWHTMAYSGTLWHTLAHYDTLYIYTIYYILYTIYYVLYAICYMLYTIYYILTATSPPHWPRQRGEGGNSDLFFVSGWPGPWSQPQSFERQRWGKSCGHLGRWDEHQWLRQWSFTTLMVNYRIAMINRYCKK